MKIGTRYLPAVLAGALVLTASAIAVTTAGAEQPTDAIDWQPCADAEGVDCATIEVPLDWEDPDGETIEVGLARRPATNPDARIGSVLMDPGGPGGSGVEAVKQSEMFTPEVNERFDVVGFDPRGINTSTQLTCDEDLVAASEAAKAPTDQAEFEELAAANQALSQDCREQSGALYDHVDNLHVAQDMDAIRESLGEEKLTYVGYSYGSIMGQQYAEMFPENIRAFVLDGNMDHSLETTWDFMSTETAPVEENFVAFAQWCDETAECALNGTDTLATYGELREKAKAGELTDPETGEPLDFYDLSDIAFGANFPEMWPDVADSLKAINDGTGTVSAKVTKAAEPINFPIQAMWCQDWNYPVEDFAEWEQLNADLAQEYPNVQWTSYNRHALSCVGYDGETTNPQAPLEIEGDPSIVMLGNQHDFATVYPWTQTAAEQSGATLVTYEGYGHTIFGGPSDCINDPISSYLIDLEVPEDGLSCPALEVPGGESPSGNLSAPMPLR